jgi:hypothetical protein
MRSEARVKIRRHQPRHGLFGRRDARSPEAAALDRAATEVAFTMATSEQCLLWLPGGLAAGALAVALRSLAAARPPPQHRVSDEDVVALLGDARILRAVTEQYAAVEPSAGTSARCSGTCFPCCSSSAP